MTDPRGLNDPTPALHSEDAPIPATPPRKQESGPPTTSRTRQPAAAKPPVFFVVLVVLVIAKAWLMRGFALGSWNPVEVVFEVACVVAVMGLFDIIPPRRWYWLDFAVYSLISALLFALTVYVHFYSQLFDPSMTAMAGQLGTVTDAISQLIKPVYVLFFIDLPVLAFWIVSLRRQARRQRERAPRPGKATVHPRPQQPERRSRYVILVTAVAYIVLVGQVVTTLEVPAYVDGVAIARSRGMTVAQVAVFLPHPSEAADDSGADVAAPGVSVASAATATATAATSTALLTPGGKAEARIEHIRGALQGSRIATFSPGAFKGKNVIIIQVEALNEMVVKHKIDGQEITPNLNKLIGESWYFPNMYSEAGIGNTADAEFTVNSSLYSPRTQAAPVLYADRTIPALPRLLNAQGYDTFTMHTNRVTYWNRKELYAALGFSRYYDAPFFHWTDIMGMGPSDEVLFNKALKVLASEDASKTPFYGQFITLSAHTPFEFIPASRRPVKTPAEYRGSLLGNYISAQSYSDLAIGQFIDGLKAAKLWDKSIVIIYGDHSGMLDNRLDGTDAKAAEALLGRAYGPADRQRVTMIMHLPGQTQPVLNTSTAGEVDIMPTVADLLGVDLSQVPHMGRSVFVDSNALVPFDTYLPGGSFANDRVVFMPGLGFDDGTAVNVADDAPAKPTPREQTDYERMLQLTNLSSKWVLGLPKRKDAGSLGDAWIPDPNARKAAKPLGANQKGLGSQ